MATATIRSSPAPQIGVGRRGHRSRQRLGRRVIQLAHVLLQRACVQPEGEQQVADVGQPHQQYRLHAAVAAP